MDIKKVEETLEGQKLLIVDDDNVWLNQLSRAMSRRGLIVYEAQSVKDALDILVKEKFDFLGIKYDFFVYNRTLG